MIFNNFSIHESILLNDWIESLIVTLVLCKVSFVIVGKIGIDDSYVNSLLYFVIYLVLLCILWVVLSIFTFFKMLPIT